MSQVVYNITNRAQSRLKKNKGLGLNFQKGPSHDCFSYIMIDTLALAIVHLANQYTINQGFVFKIWQKHWIGGYI